MQFISVPYEVLKASLINIFLGSKVTIPFFAIASSCFLSYFSFSELLELSVFDSFSLLKMGLNPNPTRLLRVPENYGAESAPLHHHHHLLNF